MRPEPMGSLLRKLRPSQSPYRRAERPFSCNPATARLKPRELTDRRLLAHRISASLPLSVTAAGLAARAGWNRRGSTGVWPRGSGKPKHRRRASGLSRVPWRTEQTRRSRAPVVGRVFPRVAEAAEYGHDLGDVAWGHVGERRADGRSGVRQVRAGQVAEPGEVTGGGRISGRVRGHGRHPVRSGRRLARGENGRRIPEEDAQPT